LAAIPHLQRGSVFRAEHDPSFIGWHDDEPRSKICVVFNATPPSLTDDVHYFMATSQVTIYRENPNLMGDALEFPKGSYPFFTKDTVVNFRELYVVPFAKLRRHKFALVGALSEADLERCEAVAGKAIQLLNRSKRLLGLLT
jgi:hypothetical protein